MSVKNGQFAKVTILGNLIAEMGTYQMSGFNRDVLEHSSFGTTVKKFIAGHVDGGEISLSGYYDTEDDDGQRILEAACLAGTLFTENEIKVYIDTVNYFTVGSAGRMFVTKAGGVSMDKFGIATTDFTIKVAGAAMTLHSDTSLSVSASPSTSPSSSVSPSNSPSASPSESPSISPSVSASESPSVSPSISASISPSVSPSASPSVSPSE